MESIRTVIKNRDNLTHEEIDELFAEARFLFNEGEDPEEIMYEVFGLEPDYLFDVELALW